MNRFLGIGLLLTLMVGTSSCFQIIEDLTINEDQSGKIKITVNLSESKTKVKSIMLLDSINGRAVPKKDQIEAELVKLKSKMNAADGISIASFTADWDEYIFKISCDFDHVDKLHGLSKDLLTKSGVKDSNVVGKPAYVIASNSFIRNGGYNVKSQYAKLKEEDRQVFESAEFIGVYKFKKPVKSSSNKSAKISKSGTAVMLRVQILDLILGKDDLSNEIKF